MRRDLYASQADCMKDWGADPAKCEPERQTSRSGTSSSSRYYGPAYSHGSHGSSSGGSYGPGSVTEARPGSRAVGTAHVSRGGFGSSASSHGSGSHGSSGS